MVNARYTSCQGLVSLALTERRPAGANTAQKHQTDTGMHSGKAEGMQETVVRVDTQFYQKTNSNTERANDNATGHPDNDSNR